MSSKRSGSPRPQRSSTRVPSPRSSATRIPSAQSSTTQVPSLRPSTTPRTPSPLTVEPTPVSRPLSPVDRRTEARWDSGSWQEAAWEAGLYSRHRTSRFDPTPSIGGLPPYPRRLSPVTIQRSRSGSPVGISQRSRSPSPTVGQRSRSEPPRREPIQMKPSKTITAKHSDEADIPFASDTSTWAQQLRDQRKMDVEIPGMANRRQGGQSEHVTRMMINFLDRDRRQRYQWEDTRTDRETRERVKYRGYKKGQFPEFVGPINYYLEMQKIIDEVQTYILTASYCKLDREQKFAYEHLWTTAQKMKELRILYNRCYVTKQPGLYNQISHVLEYCQRATRDPKRNVAVLAGFAREIYTLTQQLHAEIEPLRKRYKEDAAFRKVTNRDDLARRSSSGMNVLQTARSTMRPQDPPTVPGSDDTAE